MSHCLPKPRLLCGVNTYWHISHMRAKNRNHPHSHQQPLLSATSPPFYYLPFLNTSLSFCLLPAPLHTHTAQLSRMQTHGRTHRRARRTHVSQHASRKAHAKTRCYQFFFFFLPVFFKLSPLQAAATGSNNFSQRNSVKLTGWADN